MFIFSPIAAVFEIVFKMSNNLSSPFLGKSDSQHFEWWIHIKKFPTNQPTKINYFFENEKSMLCQKFVILQCTSTLSTLVDNKLFQNFYTLKIFSNIKTHL